MLDPTTHPPASEEAVMGDASPSRWYDGWFYATVMDPLLAGMHEYVADHLPAGERVLDAACGTGSLAARIASRGRSVVGVDMSPSHIAHARQRVTDTGLPPGRLRFEVADLRTLEPPDDGPYDVAVIVLALHEMPTAARATVVGRLAAVADQAVLVDFAAPLPWNVAGITKRAAEIVAGWDHHAAHRDFIARGGLDAVAAAAGVEVVDERTIGSGSVRVLTVRRRAAD
jgi:SAM-dependent methyltransferase